MKHQKYLNVISLLGLPLVLGISACQEMEDGDDVASVDTEELASENMLEEGPVELETPIAEFVGPYGSELRFFVGEDGGAGVVELGQEGDGSVLAVLPEDATALEVFHAVADPDMPIPGGLWEASVADDEAGIVERDLLSNDQGWVWHAEDSLDIADKPDYLHTIYWCNSNSVFNSEFCSTSTSYPNSYCQNDTTSTYNYTRYSYNYSGGYCRNSGSNPYTSMRWQARSYGTCNLTGSATYVWAGYYQWGSYTWNGAYRDWRFYKSGGGSTDYGHKWKPGTCAG